MLKNYKIATKAGKATGRNSDCFVEFCTTASPIEVNRVVDLIVKNTQPTKYSKAQTVIDTLKLLGHEVLDGVQYTEVYTFTD